VAISTLNGIALFAGIGGLELGLRTFDDRINTVCYVEGEAYAVASTIAKMEEGLLDEAPIWSDVKTFNGHAWRGKVDWISAGFPCQPFSNAGKQKRTKDERWIWEDIIRIINEVRPKFIFLENVAAFVNSWDAMSTVLRTLAESGFNAEWECFKAKDVGANHHRNRFFLFAYSDRTSRKQIKQGMGLSDSNRGGGNVADSDSSRFKEQRGSKSNGSQYTPIECSNWWQIEPALGRLADGVPHRVDSLRASGNGVVPLQAAYAFHVLSTKAGFRFGGE